MGVLSVAKPIQAEGRYLRPALIWLIKAGGLLLGERGAPARDELRVELLA